MKKRRAIDLTPSKGTLTFVTAGQLMRELKALQRCTTGSQRLDALVGGGFEQRAIVEFIGELQTGKTQLAFQLCVTIQLPSDKGGLDGEALYIDSEGTFRPERFLQIAERFGLNGEEVLEKVHYIRAYSTDQLFLIIDNAVQLVQERHVKLIVIDSVYSYFRTEYVGRGTLSERQLKLNKLVYKLSQIAETYHLIVIITNQAINSPGLFFSDPTRPYGGYGLSPPSTYRLYLRKLKGTRRIARLIDCSWLPEGEAPFEITERGVED